MKKSSFSAFIRKTVYKKEHYPWDGQLELTYRCSLNCVHCFCKGSEDKKRELATGEWKQILDTLRAEGCIWINFTGGDPLVRDDFLEIYAYAKARGFIITLFTTGYGLTPKILHYLEKSPPSTIEITLNGITKDTYEAITQVKDSFPRVIRNIKSLAKLKTKLILKSNCLKQNKGEIVRIKAWTEELLGKRSEKKYRFKYGTLIYPRLNGDKSSCDHRLGFEEILKLRKQDPDIWKEYQKELHSDYPDLDKDRAFLYQCTSWMLGFFINPYGRLKFCEFSDKFSVDLKTTAFREGFYHVFPQVLNERFRSDSKCRDCDLRRLCHYCPAKAYLETGNEEGPVPYYCYLAKKAANAMTKATAKEPAASAQPGNKGILYEKPNLR
jgi:radical SAM protein with 4Fe4S-binding SPASM domain